MKHRLYVTFLLVSIPMIIYLNRQVVLSLFGRMSQTSHSVISGPNKDLRGYLKRLGSPALSSFHSAVIDGNIKEISIQLETLRLNPESPEYRAKLNSALLLLVGSPYQNVEPKRLATIRYLLKLGADPNGVDQQSNSFVYKAKNQEVRSILLGAGGKMGENEQLLEAIEKGDRGEIDRLLSISDFSPYSNSRKQVGPLNFLIYLMNRSKLTETPEKRIIVADRLNLIELLLSHPSKKVHLREEYNGQNAIELAIQLRDKEVIQALIKHGLKLESVREVWKVLDFVLKELFSQASSLSSLPPPPPLPKELSEFEVSTSMKSEGIKSPLFDEQLLVQIKKLFLTTAAEFKVSPDFDAFFYQSVHAQRSDILLFLADTGFKFSDRNTRIIPEFMSQITDEINQEVRLGIQALIKIGAPVNTKTRNVYPLTFSVSRSDFELTELLLKSGASTKRQDTERCSPLAMAIERNNIGIAKLLLTYGANGDDTYYETFWGCSISDSPPPHSPYKKVKQMKMPFEFRKLL